MYCNFYCTKYNFILLKLHNTKYNFIIHIHNVRINNFNEVVSIIVVDKYYHAGSYNLKFQNIINEILWSHVDNNKGYDR